MPAYRFLARYKEGPLLTGRVVDRDLPAARQRLAGRPGLTIVSIRRDWWWTLVQHWEERRSPGRDEQARLFHQLGLLLHSGVDLGRSLHILSESAGSGRLAEALRELSRGVQGGQSLSQCCARFPSEFPPVVVGMLRVGEQTGAFVAVMRRCAFLLEKEADRVRRLHSALAYPFFVLLGSVAMLAGLVLFFLPRLSDILLSFKIPLSLPLRALLATGQLLADPVAVFLALESLGFAMFFLIRWLRGERGKRWLDRAVLRTPVIRRVVVESELARLVDSLALLSECGCNLSDSLRLLAGACQQSQLRLALQQVQLDVEDGQSLARAMRAQPHFRGLLAQMVEVGEETGRLAPTLEKLRQIYEQQVNHTLEVATALLEPLVLVTMGLSVGTLMLIFFLPLSQLIQAL